MTWLFTGLHILTSYTIHIGAFLVPTQHTTMAEQLKQVFAAKKAEGEPAFVTFVTAGYPTREDTVPNMLALEAGGADIIELGIPFSDPTADGPVIQEANTVSRRIVSLLFSATNRSSLCSGCYQQRCYLHRLSRVCQASQGPGPQGACHADG
jgi:hypothetical protein